MSRPPVESGCPVDAPTIATDPTRLWRVAPDAPEYLTTWGGSPPRPDRRLAGSREDEAAAHEREVRELRAKEGEPVLEIDA